MVKIAFIVIFLFFAEYIYLRIARFYKIKDDPNHRSAHSSPTLRGGGIIFIPAILLFIIFFPNESSNYHYIIASILLVAIISFIDDLVSLSTSKRMIIHFIAFTLIFYDLHFFNNLSLLTICFITLCYLFSLGFLNIYNFMDGINGMTFLNALVTFSTFLIINRYVIEFTDSNLLLILISSTLVFGFYNFRLKPKCFAGDVGSITIGFAIIYLIIKLFLESNSFIIFLMLGVYLLDGGWTIIERVIRKENVLKAHRRHMYQLFANDLKMNHLKISTGYFMVQTCLNILVVYSIISNPFNDFFILLSIMSLMTIVYFLVKIKVYKKIGSTEHNEK
ncbi:glycosyltransferase family 4 protein [Litoribaculum gwangyangense]